MSDNVPQIEDQWISDSDTIMVRYSFWAEKGRISFVIFNKTNRQIFVDWKNSALIANDQKVDYWKDETTFHSASVQRQTGIDRSRTQASASFDWTWITSSVSNQWGASLNSGTLVRNERITSVPPRSYIGVERFNILTTHLTTAPFPREVKEVSSSDHPKRPERIAIASFDKQSSPIRFRNYLTFSFHEGMQDSFSIDDSFWLSSISDMSYKHYQGKYLGKDNDGYAIFEKPYKKRTRFYSKD